jgi:hypothetical protein
MSANIDLMGVAEIGNAAFTIRVSDLTHHDQIIEEEGSITPS